MVQNFAQRRREEFNRKKYDESTAKLRLPKQYLSTDKDRGARYRGVKEKSQQIPNKIEQTCKNLKRTTEKTILPTVARWAVAPESFDQHKI